MTRDPGYSESVEPVDPAGSGSVDPAGSGSVDPGGSGSVDPGGSGSVDPGGSQSVDPGGSQSVDPAGSPTARPNLRDLDRQGLRELFGRLGEPSYRATQVWRRLHRHRARSLEELTELPMALRRRLSQETSLPSARIVESAKDSGGTEKFILDLSEGEGRQIEAVWIVGDGRRTICVSCQIGCTLDCSFCATGRMRFGGNLAVWEILEQVYVLELAREERATNVVFMGMGEPFHNYDAVLAAADILHDEEGAGLGARRITISTAGVIPGIDRFTEEARPYRLAISLNHSDPERRREIMSHDRKWPLHDLLLSARRYARESQRRVTFEYVLIAGVNDGPEDLRRLITIARSVRCKINLIPLNTAFEGLERPSPKTIEAFRRGLVDAGVDAFNRGSPGLQVSGACGMLALDRQIDGQTIDLPA